MARLRKVSPIDAPYYAAAQWCEDRADRRDNEIREFFQTPSKRLFVNGMGINLATALDMSYYGLKAPAYAN